ncbi:MAG: ABC transporter permease [Chloroflexota bacterium]
MDTISISPRWRKVLRDLWHNKTRTFLVILSIAIGVMSVGMISGSQIILQRDMRASYLDTNPRHAVLYTSLFDDKVSRVIEKMPEVAEAEGRREFNVRVQGQQSTDLNDQTDPNAASDAEWFNLELHVIDDFHQIQINTFRHLSGPVEPPKRTLLMERESLNYMGLSIGDEVRIQLDEGLERWLTISGIVHDVNQVSPSFSSEMVGYISPSTLASLGLPWGYDELNLTVTEHTDDREHILSVAESVKEKLEQGGITVYREFVPDPGKHWAHDDVESMLYLLGVLGFLSLLLSGFLVINTISALLTHHTPQIGIMKTVGARTPQLTGIYTTTVIIYGLLSLIVAVPLGALGAYGLTRYITSLLNFDILSFEVAPQTLALEVGVGLITPLCAALVPIWRGVRITVREAISSYGLGRGQFGQSVIDRWTQAIRGIPRPIMLSFRNTIRRKARLVIVLSTLTLASAIFISVLSVQASLMLTLNDTFRYWNYDFDIDFDRTYRVEALEQGALSVPGVEQAEAWGFQGVFRKRSENELSDRLLMIAPTPGTSFIDPIVMEGRWLLPEDRYKVVINSELLQDEPDLQVGDMLTLEIDGKESKWEIVGLVKQPLSGRFLYVNYTIFGQAVGTVGRVGNVRVSAPLPEGTSPQGFIQDLEEDLKKQGFQVSDITSMAREREGSRNQLNIIVIFLLIMAILLAVVGGLGLMGTMFINVMERTREVGVMRALGASNQSVMGVVVVEGIVIGLISWCIGVVISMPLSKVMSDQVGNLFLGAPATFTFSGQGAILWLGIIAIIATLASLLPAWNASKITVREALAYQ